MAADNTHYEFQPRQRMTSDGLNDQSAWIGRLAPEILRWILLGDAVRMSGVISGLIPAVVAGTMNVQVGTGLGVQYDATIPDPDSQHRWIEVGSAGITVTLDAGGANPRWDAIEIVAGHVDGPPDILDVYDPAIGAPVATPLSPLKICTPTVYITKGTEGANPKFPAGTAGRIPLAYVYVAAGAVVLNVDRIWHCRALLTPRRGVYRNEDKTSIFSPYQENFGVAGGGWEIASDGYSGTLATSMSGAFPENGLPFYIPSNANIALVTAGNYEGGGLPGGNTLVHAYVAPPPYPAGYDSWLGPRELFISDTTTPGVSSTVPAGARNCIVLMSSSGPSLNTGPLGLRGNPNASTGTFTDNLWGAFTRQRSTLIYVGAAFHAIDIPGLVTQRVVGARVAPKRKTGFVFTADLPIAAPTSYNMWGSIVGDDAMVLPETARHMVISGEFNLLTTGTMFLKMEDDATGGSSHGLTTMSLTNVSAATKTIGSTYAVRVSSAGSIQLNEAVVASIGPLGAKFYLREYTDVIIASR